MEEKEVLVYVKPVCTNPDGTFEYNMYFSETPQYVWGVSWDVDNPSTNSDMTPEKSTYSSIYKLVTDLPFKTVQETNCYSLEYATYGIIALSWIDIDRLDVYPSFGRMVLHFGDSMEYVTEEISKYNWTLEKIEE